VIKGSINMSIKQLTLLISIPFVFASMTGCATIKLGPSYNQPITEQVLEEGKTDKKVLIINIDGVLNDEPKKGLLATAPSLMDSTIMQLRKAEEDDDIVAVLLKINSPGGGVTVSDILYHELVEFKKRSKKKLYVQMMGLTASGGVYISMAADHIQAHPSTITGSVGVISITADISGTMDKIGAKVNVYKTGDNKDMGSPFREASESDKQAFETMVQTMVESFYELVQHRNKLTEEQMSVLKTAKVVTGTEAKKLGLVDSIGYLSDATKHACELGEAKDCKVVSYRYSKNENATTYSPSMQSFNNPANLNLIDLPLAESIKLPAGVYYLYLH